MELKKCENLCMGVDIPEVIQRDWWNPSNLNSFFASVYREGDNSLEGNLSTLPLNMKQRTIRESDIIEHILQPRKNDMILDCPCGIGRHTIELAYRGYRLLGIDLDEKALKQAETFASRHLLRNMPKFKLADMRNQSVPDASFDYAINMFLSFGFFWEDADNLRVLAEFYRILKPGGKLVVHTDVNPLRLENHSYADRTLRTLPKTGHLVIRERFDSNQKRLEGVWQIYKEGLFDKQSVYSIRIYSHIEMSKMFERVGFVQAQVFSINHNSVSNDPLSQEIVYVATKGAS
jgi:ubiquinone/menaquinone biosynthesis C-methylase UbiE